MSDPLISFVIRTYNEQEFLGLLLDKLKAQANVTSDREVIVVDSGSTDNTVEIAKARKTSLIEIAKEHFDYSSALNIGINASHGDVIVIISAHAIPVTDQWLQLMLGHFKDNNVAGVFCRQIPWPEAYWREVRRLENMFADSSRTFQLEDAEYVRFSNAASCIRRSAWEKHPFIMPAAEDLEWAAWMVKNGLKIVYEANALVYHSHSESCRQMARRMIQLEKAADIRLKRKRGLMLTIRQSIGCASRDLRDVFRLPNPKPGRPRLICDIIVRSYWFVRDFARAGA